MLYMELHINDGAEAKTRRFREALDSQLKQVVLGWHANILPGHFQLGAARKYGYKKRSEKYQLRKRRKGGLPALVFSGRARDKLTRPSFFKVSSSGGRAAGKFIVGSDLSYFYMTRPGGPNKPKEVTRTTVNEDRQIRDFLLKTIPEKVAAGRGAKRIVR